MALQVGQQLKLSATVVNLGSDGSITLKLETGHTIHTTSFDLREPRPAKRPRLGRLAAVPAPSAPQESFEEDSIAAPPPGAKARRRERACSLITTTSTSSPLPSSKDIFFQVLPKVCTYLRVHEVGRNMSLVCKRANKVTREKSFLKCLDVWVTDDHAYVNYSTDYEFETRLTRRFSPGSSFTFPNDSTGARTVVGFLKRFNWGNLRQLSLRVDNPSCAITRDGIRELISILQRTHQTTVRGYDGTRRMQPSFGDLLLDVTIDQGRVQYPNMQLESLLQVLVAKAKRLRDLSVHGVSLLNDKILNTVKRNQSLSCLQLNSKALTIPPEHMFKQVRFEQLHLDSFDLEKSPTLAGCLLDCTEHLTLYNCKSLPCFSSGRRRSPRLRSLTLNCRKGTSDAKITKFFRSLPPSIKVLKIRGSVDRPNGNKVSAAEFIQMWSHISSTLRAQMTHVEWKGSSGVVMYPSRGLFPRLSCACVNERQRSRSRKKTIDAY